VKSRLLVFSVLFASLSLARTAHADGKRDLEDGIAFYENLDNERALDRLKAASTAKDLDAAARAKAFLYLGMLQFETGDKNEAARSWKSAFQLKRAIEIPSGTSPKTIEAIEAVRSQMGEEGEPGGAKKTVPPEGPKGETPPVGPKGTGGEVTAKTGGNETPGINDKPQGSATTNPLTQTTPSGGDDDTTTWLLIGGIGAAVIVGAIVIFLVAHNSGDCNQGGGCLTVNFQ
jgi:hypothetical protein